MTNHPNRSNTPRKALVDHRIEGGSGFVYSGDRNERIGFSPVGTIRAPRPAGIPEDAIVFWCTAWGAPSKENLPHMVAALRRAFPDRVVTPAWA